VRAAIRPSGPTPVVKRIIETMEIALRDTLPWPRQIFSEGLLTQSPRNTHGLRFWGSRESLLPKSSYVLKSLLWRSIEFLPFCSIFSFKSCMVCFLPSSAIARILLFAGFLRGDPPARLLCDSVSQISVFRGLRISRPAHDY
jgi:hypothetical protein